mmetsp:Transcript_12336/g.30172  ORF Transcript_12336/g.30172 Transcript_12336/m.30172 type:complete len:200 (+) Transcript_12336:197-796(+)
MLLVDLSIQNPRDYISYAHAATFKIAHLTTTTSSSIPRIYFLRLPMATPTPPKATVRGTNTNPATAPALNPMNGTSAPLANKNASKPAAPAAPAKKAGAPMSNAPATSGNNRGAPSTAMGASPLMRSCWLFATRERRPRSSRRGRSSSALARVSPCFSSLESTPSSAVCSSRPSSRTRERRGYCLLSILSGSTLFTHFL